jgi:hypothetical protein
MLLKDPVLAEAWRDSQDNETEGIRRMSAPATWERVREVGGTTPHVNVRHMKRTGKKKTRMAVDGPQEPTKVQAYEENPDLLYSPALVKIVSLNLMYKEYTHMTYSLPIFDNPHITLHISDGYQCN